MNEKKLKILVGYHKPADIIRDDIFVPIHLGRALGPSITKDGILNRDDFQWLTSRMIGDDTGENISDLNRYYCELTGIYWAWKNYTILGDPEYIGFNHYRRMLAFSNEDQGTSCFVQCLSSMERMRLLASDVILPLLDEYDIFVPQATSVDAPMFVPKPPLKNDEQYKSIVARETLPDVRGERFRDIAMERIRTRWAEFVRPAEEYESRRNQWKWNIFILKKTIFFDYCEFIFDILFSVEPNVRGVPFLSIQHKRVLAFLGEWLTGVYILRNAEKKEHKIRELQPILILNTVPTDIPEPAFKENDIPIFFSIDDRYFYDGAVAIQSIISNASDKNNYDIFVLWDHLAEVNRTRLLALQMEKRNISIRLFYMGHIAGDLALKAHGYFSSTIYFRLFASIVFCNYNKIIYLDSDTLLVSDIADLYNTDIENYWIAGCRDLAVMCRTRMDGWERESYYTDDLGLPGGTLDYFNSGVMLINVEEFRKNNLIDPIIRHIENQRTEKTRQRLEKNWVDEHVGDLYLFPDQDILNVVCNGHVLYLDLIWNVLHNYGSRKDKWHLLPLEYHQQYIQARKNAKLIHYAGKRKPKNTPVLDMAYQWWNYARQTPLYEALLAHCARINAEEIIKKVCEKTHHLKENEKEENSSILIFLRDNFSLSSYRKKLKRINFRLYFTWGQKREKYISRKLELEREIQRIEKCAFDLFNRKNTM